MHPTDIEQCLKSMEIAVDSREQASAKAMRRYHRFGCPYYRQCLDYGDYTYNFRIPNGEYFFPKDIDRLGADVVVERKMSLDELAGNFCERLKDSPDARKWNHDHPDRQIRNRFEYEFIKAKESGAKVYLLVEDANFENLYSGKYRTRMNPKSFIGSLWSFCAKYNITPIFCKSDTSGKVIHDILFYELRRRLESGVYG